jgi:hypothetical protein
MKESLFVAFVVCSILFSVGREQDETEFHHGQRVRVVSGFHRGREGKIVDCYPRGVFVKTWNYGVSPDDGLFLSANEDQLEPIE